MAAISTTLFAFLRAGDTIVHSRPLYGGTETLLQKQMGAFGVTAFGFADGINIAEMRKTAEAARARGRVGLILVETPANPTSVARAEADPRYLPRSITSPNRGIDQSTKCSLLTGRGFFHEASRRLSLFFPRPHVLA